MEEKEAEVKNPQSPDIGETVKRKTKRQEFRIPDLTPDDVREALLDWLRKQAERWGKGDR